MGSVWLAGDGKRRATHCALHSRRPLWFRVAGGLAAGVTQSRCAAGSGAGARSRSAFLPSQQGFAGRALSLLHGDASCLPALEARCATAASRRLLRTGLIFWLVGSSAASRRCGKFRSSHCFALRAREAHSVFSVWIRSPACLPGAHTQRDKGVQLRNRRSLATRRPGSRRRSAPRGCTTLLRLPRPVRRTLLIAFLL